MATYKIVQVGDPVLRKRAREVTRDELASPAMQDMIARMRDTMRDAPGVGLAAPQIGESLQLAVIEDPPHLHAGLSPEQIKERERAAVPFHVIVNPAYTPEGDERVLAYEGCLSFAGFAMIVPRWRSVRVEALDEHGQPFSRVATGWYARILQHEIDHLHGTVCCDRMVPRTLTSQDNQMRHWRTTSVEEALAILGPVPNP
ncbi:MAG TPA: peptide deformylase [Kofleriaceae bacterium]|nr:peptide deformylase [Kofleriaceae bacterium]